MTVDLFVNSKTVDGTAGLIVQSDFLTKSVGCHGQSTLFFFRTDTITQNSITLPTVLRKTLSLNSLARATNAFGPVQ